MGNILGQAEKEFQQEQPKTGQSSEMDRNSFLKLLVTQLEHQDPTDPMKDRQFVAELAQFSSLEQMTNIAEGVKKLNAKDVQSTMLQAADLIGKEVKAQGEEISKDGEDISSVYYELSETAKNVSLNIFDSGNNLLRTVQLGAKQPGSHEFAWDGKSYEGQTMPDGVYRIGISAEGLQGQPLQASTEVSGEVVGLKQEGQGVVLTLQNGREVQWNQVKELVDQDN